MRAWNLICVWVLATVNVSGTVELAPVGQDLDLRIDCEKKTLISGEPVVFSISATNRSSREIIIPWPKLRPNSLEADFVRASFSGDRVIQDSGCKLGDVIEPLRLQAGETYFYREIFEETLIFPGVAEFEAQLVMDLKPVGVPYSGIPGNKNENLGPIFYSLTGVFRSNKVHIRVEKPSAAEDVSAFSFLRGDSTGALNGIREAMDRLIVDYPSSAYTAYARFLKCKVVQDKDPRRDLEMRERLIDQGGFGQFEDDAYFHVYRAFVLRDDKENASRILKKIADRLPLSDHGIRAIVILDSREWEAKRASSK